jgi:hypothetical protein
VPENLSSRTGPRVAAIANGTSSVGLIAQKFLDVAQDL